MRAIKQTASGVPTFSEQFKPSTLETVAWFVSSNAKCLNDESECARGLYARSYLIADLLRFISTLPVDCLPHDAACADLSGELRGEATNCWVEVDALLQRKHDAQSRIFPRWRIEHLNGQYVVIEPQV